MNVLEQNNVGLEFLVLLTVTDGSEECMPSKRGGGGGRTYRNRSRLFSPLFRSLRTLYREFVVTSPDGWDSPSWRTWIEWWTEGISGIRWIHFHFFMHSIYSLGAEELRRWKKQRTGTRKESSLSVCSHKCTVYSVLQCTDSVRTILRNRINNKLIIGFWGSYNHYFLY